MEIIFGINCSMGEGKFLARFGVRLWVESLQTKAGLEIGFRLKGLRFGVFSLHRM